MSEPIKNSEQLLVGYLSPNGVFVKTTETKIADEWGKQFTLLYTHPVVEDYSLTDEEIQAIAKESYV
jgi:hypothetical protein